MKVLCLMLFLFPFALAQTNQSIGPNVTVIQMKWRMDVRNPALDKDPIRTMKEREGQEQLRKDADRTNDMLSDRGMPTSTSTVPAPARDTAVRGLTVTYVYEAKVTNTGEKGIRKLVWDYVFFEQGTETEVGRRRFVSKVSIGPGKTRDVVFRSASSPTGTVDARNAGKKPRDQYSEKVVIQGLEYADGSVWQAVSQ